MKAVACSVAIGALVVVAFACGVIVGPELASP